MAQLFEQPAGESAESPDPGDGTVVRVAVNAVVWGQYDYLWPADRGEVRSRVRVRVPFGRGDRRTTGFVLGPREGPRPSVPLKTIAEVLDDEPPLHEGLWQLGRWISSYYLAPLGAVLAAMVPSAVGQFSPKRETVAYLSAEPEDWPATLGARQRSVLDELLEARAQGVEPLPLQSLRRHSGASRDTIRRLVSRGLIRTEHRRVRLDSPAGSDVLDDLTLNDDQQRALDGVVRGLGRGYSATLLHGVTGSGKTEVYIRAIRQAIADGGQALLLVPEIALAAQTLHRLLARLPRVAVLHSSLTAAQRAHSWQQIRDGHASVVVGPRSAVFAPTPSLKLIVVDEEHESSYKQDTTPRYHGRDVAVKRASLENVPILLGSATPSLESMHNAQSGRYQLLRLPHRIRGLPMPSLEIVPLRKELSPRRIELIGRTLTTAIAGRLDRNEQTILLLNRRGYASYVFCPSCQWMMGCEHCTRPMVYHQATQTSVCHYCGHTAGLVEACPACRGKVILFGIGIQRVETELGRKFPDARVARMDSDTMTSPAQFRKVFDAFAAGEVDILLGTQMVAKGLDFPKVSLVGVVSADTSLAVPDFRASERTFQLIVQVAGRAGRSQLPGQVVVQTLHPEEPAVQLAAGHDYEGFVACELPLRQEVGLPPYRRLVRILVRHGRGEQADADARQVMNLLGDRLEGQGIEAMGPQPAGIVKLRDQFRFHVILSADRPGKIQQVVWPVLGPLNRLKSEVIFDVDPTTLA